MKGLRLSALYFIILFLLIFILYCESYSRKKSRKTTVLSYWIFVTDDN